MEKPSRVTSAHCIQQPSIRGGVISTLLRVIFAVLATAAVTVGTARAEERRHPLEPVDHASPRATLTGFIDKANEIYRILQAREERPVNALELAQREEHLLRCLDLLVRSEIDHESQASDLVVS